jgi:hypothetical protein
MTNSEADLHRLAHLERKMQANEVTPGTVVATAIQKEVLRCLEPGSSASALSDALVMSMVVVFSHLF